MQMDFRVWHNCNALIELLFIKFIYPPISNDVQHRKDTADKETG